MVRRFWFVPAIALLLIPAMARAEFHQRDWELTLSGSGSNGPDFNGTTLGAAGSLGYFLTDQFEVSLRQSLTFTDIGVSGGNLDGSTRIAVDFNFDLGRVGP